MSALPIGILLDNIGPQKTSLIGAALFGLGNFAMGLKESAQYDPFLTGYVLFAFVCTILMTTIGPSDCSIITDIQDRRTHALPFVLPHVQHFPSRT